MSLPLIRSHERIDYKRCPKKWYWKWRMGLVLKTKSFGALDLGTWMHAALANWYCPGYKRWGSLADLLDTHAGSAIEDAQRSGAPAYQIEKAEELAALGVSMAAAYQKAYGKDPDIEVIRAEVPLEFTISDPENGETLAVHKLKPDLVYRSKRDLGVWLMEHKTAATIRTEHLVIDDQARPYGAMAERSLRKLGLLGKDEQFKGIMYNFMRKALPDERVIDEQGRALNKNGTVSKRQPSPLFVRHPVTMTRAAKVVALRRIQGEAVMLTMMTKSIREKKIDPDFIPKTPHNSCPKTCDFFAMCTAEEQGVDITEMRRRLYTRRDPYVYEEETTTEPMSFEMG